MEKKQFWKQKEHIFLCIILIVQIAVMLFFGNMKKGYFVDELWSFGLANSYYHPHVYSDGALEQWVDGDYFREYLEVSENERFQYGSVVDNQKNDYHPPLSYIVLHTICSLFPNTFSKWYAIIPNILYFCGCMILLYKIGEVIFGDSYQALLPVIAYGLCPGAISNVVFIRMYVLLTLWVLYSSYIHVNWIKTGNMDIKSLLKLTLVSYLGFMSHYYFFIFAFFLSVCYMVFLFVKHRIKEVIPYGLAMAGSLGLVLITFPTAFHKLFFEHRGHEAVENFFSSGGFVYSLKTYSRILKEGVVSNSRILLWIGIWGGVLLIGKDILLKVKKSAQFYMVIMLGMAVVAYVGLVAKISPYESDRYIFCIYPIVSLLLSYIFFTILRKFKLPLVLCQVAVAAIFLLLAVKGICEKRVQYLYLEKANNVELVKEHSGDDCIYVTDEPYKLVGNALELENMNRVLVFSPKNMENLSEIIDKDIPEMVVYVDETLEQEEIMEMFCQNGGFGYYEFLFSSRADAYVVGR